MRGTPGGAGAVCGLNGRCDVAHSGKRAAYLSLSGHRRPSLVKRAFMFYLTAVEKKCRAAGSEGCPVVCGWDKIVHFHARLDRGRLPFRAATPSAKPP